MATFGFRFNMYKIVRSFNEPLQMEEFLVVNIITGKIEVTFYSREEAHAYVLSR
jgi:hypothetical protein